MPRTAAIRALLSGCLRWGSMLGLMVVSVSWVHAQVYWDRGNNTNNWADRNNWTGNTVPTRTSSAIFNNTYVTGAQTVNVATSNRQLNTVEFNTSSSANTYTFTGTGSITLYSTTTNFTQSGAGAITINSSLRANTGAAVIMAGNGAGVVTIGGTVSDGLSSSATTGLQKNGSFTLVLNGSNQQHGTVLNAGTIEFGNDAAAGVGSLTISGAGTIRAGSGARTLSNAVSVGSNFTIAGTNALTLSGTVNLGGQNRTITVSNTADTTFSGVVSNGSLTKSGTGTLVLAGTNTYGATTVSQGTLQVGNGGSTGTLGTGNVTNNGTIALNRSDTALVVGTNISGTGSVRQIGTGTVTMSGTNSYSGGTTVSAGKLKLSSVAALGSQGAALNLGGGGLILATDSGTNQYNTTVSANSTIEVSRASSAGTGNYTLGTLSIGNQTLSVSGTGLATDAAYSLGFGATTLTGSATLSVANNGAGTGTLSLGAVTESGGTQSVTKTGNGTLVYTGQNTYTGTTTVTGGTVLVNLGAQLADATSGLVMNGGKLTLNNASQQIATISGSSGVVELGSGNTLTVNESGAGSYGGTFSATSNTSTLAMNGTGSLTLSGDNSAFNGKINVLQGTLIATSANALGSTTATTTVSSNAALALSGNVTTNAGNLVLAGTGVSGSGALYQTSGTNTYGGSVTLSGDATIKAAGSLNIGTTSPTFSPSGHTAPAESGYVTIGGKTLTFQGSGYITVNDRIRDFAGQTAGTSYANATTLNYAPETSQPGNVVIDMSLGGTVHYLANANSYTGTTFVKNGTLVVDTITNSNTAPHDPTTDSFHGINGAVEIGNGTTGATLQLGSGGAGSANEVLSLTSTVKLYQDGTLNVNNQSQSIGGLTFSGGGTVLLGNTGHLYLNGDVVATANAGQTATISTTGQGVLDLTLHRNAGVDSGNVVRTFTVNHGAGNTSDLTIGAIIQGNVAAGNTASVVKSGDGILTFDGTNTYNGTTTVSSGVLSISRATDSNSNSGLGSTAAGTTVNSGATLQLRSLSGGTVAGVLSGETLNLSGSGYGGNGALQNTSGSNTWTGGITLNSANARIQSDSGSSLTISGGAIGGTAGSSLEVGGAGDTTIASSISSGVGGVTKNGSGTLTLSGGNAFSGPVAVSAGTLSVQNNTALAGNTATVSSGARMTFDSTANGNLLIDSGAINLNGTGVSGAGALQNTAGNNQYFGTVNLQSASTITANTGSTLLLGGTISGTGAQTLTVGTAANTGDVTVSGAFSSASGTVSLVKAGSGALNLNGGGTVGTVAVNGGTLAVGSGTTLNTGSVTVSSGSVNVSGTMNTTGSLNVGASTSMLIASGGRVNVTGSATFSSGSLNGSSGTLQVSGSNSTVAFNGTINAPNLSLIVGGTTGAPVTVYLGTNLNVASIEITGDTILDFGNSGATLLTSGVLKITNPNATVQVRNWITTSNQTTSDIWTVTNTINNQTLPNGTNSTGSPLNQITFQNPVGSTGNTTTWVGDTSQGWYNHEIRPTPEPATYGAILMTGCLGLLGWRRYQRRKNRSAE